MAISSDVSSIQYVGNNSTVTAYPVPFQFFANSHLRVVVTASNGVQTSLSLGSGFTATGAGTGSGNVLTVAAWDNTHRITIYREVPIVQTTSYAEGGDFPAASHERALDLLTMIVQQSQRRINRTLAVSESDDELNALPANPLTIIGFNSSTQPKTYTAAELVTFLNLYNPGLFEAYTQTFADSGERAAAIPAFIGQIGTQRNDGSIWISTGTSAGNWTLFTIDITPPAGSVTAAMLEDPLNLSSKTLTLPATQLVPVGTVIWYAKNTAPTKYLKCNGATISRTTYSDLFGVIGTEFGAGDGSTTFKIPDLRAEFIRGWDDGRGVDSGRTFASGQDHQVQDHKHSVDFQSTTQSVGSGAAYSQIWSGITAKDSTVPTSGNHGTETRSRNIALLPCIKYEA